MTDEQEMEIVKKQVMSQIKRVYDPEIPVNIYDLGLIYGVTIDKDFNVKVIMTLTAPNCPVADSMPNEVKERIEGIEWVNSVEIELTFEPPWTKDLMSDEAMLELGML
ncbi:MAG: iron-sulfur cluster assembly protein [Bacteroidota bacterium]|nr:iron-sulfur cluster assembly protein [Bacteroidota bacterium]